jgi:inactive serine/threonine-protein kinase TEX14
MLPAINEQHLVHDNHGSTFNNGAFMVYESMKWKDSHLVTIKRLHTNVADGGHVNLLIDELNSFRRINNFPKILALMGFCQTDNIENIILMFERVSVGSLFNILHEIKLSKMPKLKSITEIMLSVCEALIYLHEQNLLHCYVNSHSIFLTTHHSAKLGNLEYAVERSCDPNKQKKSKVVENRYLNCSWNWLAPELMADEIPNELSDMYSFCVVVWELFNTSIPWHNLKWEEIHNEILIDQNTLPVNYDLIPVPFSRIIKDGFSFNSINRMSFEEVKAALENFQQVFAFFLYFFIFG